jgi:hypothetical protein
MTTKLKLLAFSQTIGLILTGVLAIFGLRYIIEVYGTDVIVTGIQIFVLLIATWALYRIRLADLEFDQAMKQLNKPK